LHKESIVRLAEEERQRCEAVIRKLERTSRKLQRAYIHLPIFCLLVSALYIPSFST